jgi:hypothetical protein
MAAAGQRRRQGAAAFAVFLTLAAGADAARATGVHGAGANVRPAGVAPGPMPAGSPIVQVTGNVVAVHGHAARRGSTVSYSDFQLVTPRGRELTLDIRALPVLPRGGSRVRVVGRLHAGVLRARRLTVLRARPRARAAVANGTYKTLVVPFTFSSSPSNPWTVDALRTSFFTGSTSVRAYLEETSLGTVSLTGVKSSDGDIAPWQTITATTTSCNWGTWKDAAKTAAANAGWSISSYDRVIYVMSSTSACAWSGLAPYPAGSWAMLNGSTKFGVAAHELGHTFGLDHAASRSCTAGGARVWISSTCTTSDYGDPFDTMGDAWTGRWYHAFSRQRLGWLGAAQAPQITASGTYALGPAEASGSGLRALSIPRGDGLSYHLEARTPTGTFDAFSATAAVVGGVSVRLVPTQVSADVLPALLDTTPQTSTFNDAALAPGRSVTDAERKITIETLSAGPSGASVRLWIGEDAGTVAPTPDPGPTTTTVPPPAEVVPPPTVVPDPVPVPPAATQPPAEPTGTTTPATETPVVEPPATPGISVRLAAPTTLRRAARSGVRLALHTGRTCPCSVVVEIRDSAGRVVGKSRMTLAHPAATATVRLTTRGRKNLVRSARAARSTTLQVRVRVLSPGAPASAQTRLRLR